MPKNHQSLFDSFPNLQRAQVVVQAVAQQELVWLQQVAAAPTLVEAELENSSLVSPIQAHRANDLRVSSINLHSRLVSPRVLRATQTNHPVLARSCRGLPHSQ